MTTKKIIYYAFLLIWFISSGYLLYKYSLDAGYWLNPLLFSFSCYIAILIINKGFNKLIMFMTLFYVGFVTWFIVDLIINFLEIFSVD